MISAQALVLVVVANAAPVLLSFALRDRLSWPMDAGLRLPDGERLLGDHKTWRGFLGGIAAAGLAGALLGPGPGVGAAFGLLALLGDSATSFVKRRLRRAPGASMPLLDPVGEALLPLCALAEPLHLDRLAIAGTFLGFALLDLFFTRLRTSAPT